MRGLSGRGCVVLASCVLLASTCMAQQVYKWTDASGTVHYSEQPPASGVKNERMTLSGATEGTASAEAAQAEADAAADPEALQKANDAQEAHMCSVARDNLKLLDSDARIASGGDITTATQVIGEEREKARGEARSQIERYCHEK